MPGTLLERDAELAALEEAAAAARSGAGRLVRIEGPAGIGKSSLLAAVGDGLTALRSCGTEVERDVAFGVVRQLLERPLAMLDADARARVLSGAASLAEPVVSRAAVATGGTDAVSALRHGLFWTVANLADEAPLAIVVDDLQWCDDASARWLGYLAQRLDDVAVLVVIARRTGEPGVPAAVLEALTAHATRLVPAPLSAAGTRALLQRDGAEVTESVGDTCHRVTGGNPLLVAQLKRAVDGRDLMPDEIERLGAEAVADRVAARLRSRPPESVALAHAVAVLGPGHELRTAAGLAGLPGATAARAADDLVDAGLLAPGRPLAFEHPIVASAVVESIGQHERAVRHREAARVLEDHGADPGTVAAHLLQAAPQADSWVVERLLAAGQAALDRGAPVEARRLLERALVEPPGEEDRGPALMLAGTAAWLGGEPGDATVMLREAGSQVGGSDDRFRIALQLAQVLLWQGEGTEALRILSELAAQTGDVSVRLQLEAERAAGEIALGGDPVKVCERLERLHANADESLPGARQVMAALAYALAVAGAGPAARVRELVVRMRVDDALVTSGSLPLFLPTLAGVAAAVADAPAQAEAIGSQLHRLGVERGSPLLGLGAHITWAYAATVRGALRDAEGHYRDALQLGEVTGLRFLTAGLRGYLARILADEGELDEAIALVDSELPGGTTRLSGMGALSRGYSAMYVLAAAGVWPRVAELAVEAARRRGPFPALPWRIPAAEAQFAIGDRDRAHELLDEQQRIADAWGSPRLLAATSRARARLVGGDEALELLRASVEAVAGSEARLEHARSLVALGEGLRRTEHRVACREPLREGLDLADRCGAAPLAGRAADELRATGAHPRKVLLRGAASLTASELRVCRLAATGLTNREIAQELWVTRKTVETHLSHAFRKLDIASRDQLAAALEGDQSPSIAV